MPTAPAPPAAAADQAVQAAGAAIRRDADAIALRVADLLHREVLEAASDPVSREVTRRTCRATLLALIGAWQRGESLDQLEPPRELLFQIEVTTEDELDAAKRSLNDAQNALRNGTLLPLCGVGEDFFWLNESLGDRTLLDFATLYDYDIWDHRFQEEARKTGLDAIGCVMYWRAASAAAEGG